MRNIHSKPLASRHARERDGQGLFCVNQTLIRQEIFSLKLNKNPGTPLIQIVLRLIDLEANSQRNLDRGLHRYSELLIFVLFPYVQLLIINIQIVSNFSLQPVIQNCHFLVISQHTMIAKFFAGATVYLGFNSIYQWRIHHLCRCHLFRVSKALLLYRM